MPTVFSTTKKAYSLGVNTLLETYSTWRKDISPASAPCSLAVSFKERKSYIIGKALAKSGDKKREGHKRNWNPLWPTIVINKHNPSPSQMNINPHTEGLFNSVSIAQYKFSFQQKKLQNKPKGKITI